MRAPSSVKVVARASVDRALMIIVALELPACGWPKSIDDSQARRDWGWASKYDLRKMSEDMVSNLRLKLLGK